MLTYYITDRLQFAGGEAERRSQLLQTIRRAATAGVDYIQFREKDLAVREVELLAREALRVVRGEGATRLLINHRTDVALAVGADGVHLTGDDISAGDARALAAGHHPGREFLIAVSCHSAKEVRLAEAHGADFAVLAPIFEKAGAEKAGAEKAGAEKAGAEKAGAEKAGAEKAGAEKAGAEKAGAEKTFAQKSAAAGQQNLREGIGLEELRRAARPEIAPNAKIEAGEPRCSFPVFALGGVDRERAALCAAAGAAGIAGIRIFQQCSDLPELVRELHKL